MNIASLQDKESGENSVDFEQGALYLDETTSSFYVGYDWEGQRQLACIEDGVRYSDIADPFGGDEGDFRKLVSGETVMLEVT